MGAAMAQARAAERRCEAAHKDGLQVLVPQALLKHGLVELRILPIFHERLRAPRVHAHRTASTLGGEHPRESRPGVSTEEWHAEAPLPAASFEDDQKGRARPVIMGASKTLTLYCRKRTILGEGGTQPPGYAR